MSLASPRRPGRKPAINIPADPAFIDWASRFADSCRLPLAAVVDLALVEMAKVKGFSEPAPRR